MGNTRCDAGVSFTGRKGGILVRFRSGKVSVKTIVWGKKMRDFEGGNDWGS